jgi:hypothetical protein
MLLPLWYESSVKDYIAKQNPRQFAPVRGFALRHFALSKVRGVYLTLSERAADGCQQNQQQGNQD